MYYNCLTLTNQSFIAVFYYSNYGIPYVFRQPFNYSDNILHKFTGFFQALDHKPNESCPNFLD